MADARRLCAPPGVCEHSRAWLLAALSPSATCRHSITGCSALYGKEVASTVAVLRVLDEATRTSIQQALSECADLARSEVLLRHRGDFEGLIPNADECNQPAKSAKRKGVTWAMQLGTEMHEEALKCAEERLGLLRPGGFSLEQRYRYDSRTRRWKRVSPDEEKALHESGNGGELKGTLKPDVVIHSGDPLKAEAIYDYKFPCNDPNSIPDWTHYTEGPYRGLTQQRVYQNALGGALPVRIVPRWGLIE